MRGIVYGINLAIRLVEKHISPGNLKKAASDLEALRRKWEVNAKIPDFVNKNEWVGGVVYGINLAARLVRRHIAAPPTMRGQSNTPY